MTLVVILVLVLLGSAAAILAAAAFLLLSSRIQKSIVPHMVSFATGTLLGAAFLGLLPRAMALTAPPRVLAICLVGILVFLVIEKLVIWRHCHDTECTVHTRAATLILVGDAMHNFIDGVAIAAATVTSIPLGVSTAVAVIAHEIPQEVGDFAILINGGFTRRRALVYNLLSGLAAVPGAVLAYFVDLRSLGWTPAVMALSASSFIYIAVADLIPSSHAARGLSSTTAQMGLMLLGICTILLIIA